MAIWHGLKYPVPLFNTEPAIRVLDRSVFPVHQGIDPVRGYPSGANTDHGPYWTANQRTTEVLFSRGVGWASRANAWLFFGGLEILQRN